MNSEIMHFAIIFDFIRRMWVKCVYIIGTQVRVKFIRSLCEIKYVSGFSCVT